MTSICEQSDHQYVKLKFHEFHIFSQKTQKIKKILYILKL